MNDVSLHIDIHPVDHKGHKRFNAVVAGHDMPQYEVTKALKFTGGSYTNTVTWDVKCGVYTATGRVHSDPNHGDCPASLVRRLRDVVGVSHVRPETIHDCEPSHDTGSLFGTEIREDLSVMGALV